MQAVRINSVNLENQLLAVELTHSKSITNRAIIARAVASNPIELHGISDSNDSIVIQRIISSENQSWNVEDAGTALRFLLAYACAKNIDCELFGTERLHQRPIKSLVDALIELGFSVEYLNKIGFAPLKIRKRNTQTSLKKYVEVDATKSSQFVSALMLVAPLFPDGLEILVVPEKPASAPYIQTTFQLMSEWGFDIQWASVNRLRIGNKTNLGIGSYTIEKDWSAAGFWYLLVSLHPKLEIFLKGLSLNSIQADKLTAQIFAHLGVKTTECNQGVLIKNTANQSTKPIEFNLLNSPDIFPCLAVALSYLSPEEKIKFTLTGLETLAYKESDRLQAIVVELKKFGVQLIEISPGKWQLYGSFICSQETIETYNDHRLAMAFAMLGTKVGLSISETHSVQKSYPNFWTEFPTKVNLPFGPTL